MRARRAGAARAGEVFASHPSRSCPSHLRPSHPSESTSVLFHPSQPCPSHPSRRQASRVRGSRGTWRATAQSIARTMAASSRACSTYRSAPESHPSRPTRVYVPAIRALGARSFGGPCRCAGRGMLDARVRVAERALGPHLQRRQRALPCRTATALSTCPSRQSGSTHPSESARCSCL